MKRIASFLFVLALTLGIASNAVAQVAPAKKTTLETSFAPYIVGSITTAPGASGQNYTVGIGLERDTNHWYFDGSGVYSTALVTANPGQPHVGLFTLQGYYKIGGHLLAGGGGTAVLNTGAFKTSQFVGAVSAAANPFVGTGLEFGRVRSIVSYQIPVRSETQAIPEQIKFSVNNELALTRHIRVGLPLVINSYRTGNPFKGNYPRVTVAQVGGELKLVW